MLRGQDIGFIIVIVILVVAFIVLFTLYGVRKGSIFQIRDGPEFCDGCTDAPGYLHLSGFDINANVLRPSGNTSAYIVDVDPDEIQAKCLDGNMISPGNLQTAFSCNSSPFCTGVAYNATQRTCKLLGTFNPASTELFVENDGTDIYLKNCSCLGATESNQFANTCGTGAYGGQVCTGRSCAGQSLRSFCCADNSSEVGTNVWPGSCSTEGLSSASFVPYRFKGFEQSNFDNGGCVGDANCPILTFAKESEWDVDEQAAFFTLVVHRKAVAPSPASIVRTCRIENVRCLSDCATEVAYIIGIPDFLPASQDQMVETAVTEALQPGDGACVRNTKHLDLVANQSGVRFPDTILLTKGRLLVLQDGKPFNACEANNMHGNFAQDAIVARLMTISNYRDWIDLMNHDTVLQAFLRDPRFPPTTKFFWSPGNWLDSNNNSVPYGIQTDGDIRVDAMPFTGNRFCSVWIDPATFRDTGDADWRVCGVDGAVALAGQVATTDLRNNGGRTVDRGKRNPEGYGACSVLTGGHQDSIGSCRNWVLPVRNGEYTYTDAENVKVEATTDAYYIVNNDYWSSKTSTGTHAVSFTPVVRDAGTPTRVVDMPSGEISFCKHQYDSTCVMQNSTSPTCPTVVAQACNTDSDCGPDDYVCDTTTTPVASDNWVGLCRPAHDEADDFSDKAVLGICSVLDRKIGDTNCADALEIVAGDNASPDLTWCIRDEGGILLGDHATQGNGTLRGTTGTCWVHDLRSYMNPTPEAVGDAGTAPRDTLVNGVNGEGGQNKFRSNGVEVPLYDGCCLQNDECTDQGIISALGVADSDSSEG